MSISVGIDIGGTFTDVVLIERAGARFFGKALTTHSDPSEGVFASVQDALRQARRDLGEVENIIHGTTLVTNALIERKGALTGLIATQGFRDSVEIGTESRYDLFDLSIEKPQPLVPRHLRHGVRERVLVDGSVLKPLDEEHVRETVTALLSKGVEAIAVCLLHSYVAPAHEARIKAIIAEMAPHIRVSISSEVAPEIREYARASTTIANVYVQKIVEEYLRNLKEGLTTAGFRGDLLIMLSSGGISTIEATSRLPIGLLESGPVGGAVAAAYHSREQGFGDLLVFDMGGTTAKISLLDKGEPTLVHEFEVGRADRFKKGSGLPVKIPVVDMIEIGAGGGSIARVDGSGRLKIGPDSAGSEPGPVCYGRGGTEPTVTDANLVLGYLDPDFFLGGAMKIDLEAARAAIQRRIAGPLGLSVEDAAAGILQIVTENMVNAARIHGAERGEDLRAYSMFAFGGAGPLQACRVAKSLRISKVIVANGAGVLSAFGFLTVPLAFDFSRTIRGSLAAIDWATVNATFAQMEEEGRARLAEAGIAADEVVVERTCEARYAGQSHEITLPVPAGELSSASADEIAGNFVRRYRDLYHYDEGDGGGLSIEALTWRLRTRGPRPQTPALAAGAPSTRDPVKRWRAIYSSEHRAFVQAPVLDRYALRPGFTIEGPVIVEERESTFIVPENAVLAVDEFQNLVATLTL